MSHQFHGYSHIESSDVTTKSTLGPYYGAKWLAKILSARTGSLLATNWLLNSQRYRKKSVFG